jgi:toxin FitB
MIVLDTNVVSEPLKPRPDAAVMEWLDAQEPQTLFLSSITMAEILSGIETMPIGRRRTQLQSGFHDDILPVFEGRLLQFDKKAAQAFALIQAKVKTAGVAISFADCAIAAIAQANGYAVATRNVRDFKSTGVKLLNPWIDSI